MASFVRRHPRLTLALLVLGFATALDWIAGTLVLKKFDARPTGPSHRIPSATTHHALRPLTVDKDRWGDAEVEFAVNSLGCRDAAARAVSATAEQRVVFIGDSFTEGVGVDWASSWVGRVASVLPGEVLNAGVSSYCPNIYARRIRELMEQGVQFQEVVVAIDLSDPLDEIGRYMRDAVGNVVARPTAAWGGGAKGFLYQHSLTYGGITRFRQARFAASSAGRELAANEMRAGNLARSEWTMRGNATEGLKLAEGYMDELAALLKARGIALTVVVYPWPVQLERGDRDSLQVRVWRAWSTKNGARFIDLFAPFFDTPDALRRLYIPGDVHWNAEGHKFVAERFLERYRP